MTEAKLVYMANQIATAFAAQAPETAAAAVADHIDKFWEPRMRRRLLSHVAAGGAGLSPVVRAAAPLIRRPADASAP